MPAVAGPTKRHRATLAGVTPAEVRPPEPVGSGSLAHETQDAEWVRSLLTTEPGKTYLLDVLDDPSTTAARAAVVAAGREIADEVVRRAEGR